MGNRFNIIEFFSKDFSNYTSALLLFLYTAFLRLPFFFRDYVDRDESTFILMGQSWVDGHLPYTELWDIKPPLTFFFFGTLIYLAGKSFIAIRLAGVLLITTSSFFTYKIGSFFYTKKTAIAMGFLSVILQSLFGSLQGVMSEHIAMAFFMPSLWIMIKYKNQHLSHLIAGLLIGVVLMVKLNMAYAALFMGIYIMTIPLLDKRIGISLYRGTLYALGIIIVILITYVPYYFKDLSELWFKSVVLAPLEYADARKNSFSKMLLLVSPLFIYLFWTWKKGKLHFNNYGLALISVTLIGVVLSFFKSGRINGHYLILLHPIFLILIGLALSSHSNTNRKLRTYTAIILLFLIPIESYLEYFNIINNKLEKNTYYNGEGFSVPQYLRVANLDKKKVLFLEYHIGYWVLNHKPITKASTQPSNILKDEMFFAYDNPRASALEELRFIMETEIPDIIVTRKNRRFFDKSEKKANFYMHITLAKLYQPLDTIDNAVVYQRLPSQ